MFTARFLRWYQHIFTEFFLIGSFSFCKAGRPGLNFDSLHVWPAPFLIIKDLPLTFKSTTYSSCSHECLQDYPVVLWFCSVGAYYNTDLQTSFIAPRIIPTLPRIREDYIDFPPCVNLIQYLLHSL